MESSQGWGTSPRPQPPADFQRRLCLPGAPRGSTLRIWFHPPRLCRGPWGGGGGAVPGSRRSAPSSPPRPSPPRPGRPGVTVGQVAPGGAAGLAALEVAGALGIREALLRTVQIRLQLGAHAGLLRVFTCEAHGQSRAEP